MTTNVEEAWRLLKIRMENEGFTLRQIDVRRAAFISGVYAASADLLMNGVNPKALSDAADRIEKHR